MDNGTWTSSTTISKTWPPEYPSFRESKRWGIREIATGRVLRQQSAGPVDGPLDDGYEYVWRYVTPWQAEEVRTAHE